MTKYVLQLVEGKSRLQETTKVVLLKSYNYMPDRILYSIRMYPDKTFWAYIQGYSSLMDSSDIQKHTTKAKKQNKTNKQTKNKPHKQTNKQKNIASSRITKFYFI